MGFGHGLFGHGDFGNGPWVTFPYTPGFAYNGQYHIAVAPHLFDDLTEQRYLQDSAQGLTMNYDFSTVADSAIITALNSWWLAAGGPATRFLATDHNTGSSCVVRILSEFTTQRGPGLLRQVGPFILRVEALA